MVEQTLTEADACVSAEAEWGGAGTVCPTPCLSNQTPDGTPHLMCFMKGL